MAADTRLENAEAKSLQDYTYENVGTTMLPIDVKPGTPPTLRQHSRYDYFMEYVDFWMLGVKCKAKAVAFFVLGLLSINYFAPGALLLFALSAREQDIGWMCNFIIEKFGANRTIALVD